MKSPQKTVFAHRPWESSMGLSLNNLYNSASFAWLPDITMIVEDERRTAIVKTLRLWVTAHPHSPERTCFLQAGSHCCGIMLACTDNESWKCAPSGAGTEEKRYACGWRCLGGSKGKTVTLICDHNTTTSSLWGFYCPTLNAGPFKCKSMLGRTRETSV